MQRAACMFSCEKHQWVVAIWSIKLCDFRFLLLICHCCFSALVVLTHTAHLFQLLGHGTSVLDSLKDRQIFPIEARKCVF